MKSCNAPEWSAPRLISVYAGASRLNVASPIRLLYYGDCAPPSLRRLHHVFVCPHQPHSSCCTKAGRTRRKLFLCISAQMRCLLRREVIHSASLLCMTRPYHINLHHDTHSSQPIPYPFFSQRRVCRFSVTSPSHKGFGSILPCRMWVA
jgi:hypothetical protein